jgi:hypothetical protein
MFGSSALTYDVFTLRKFDHTNVVKRHSECPVVATCRRRPPTARSVQLRQCIVLFHYATVTTQRQHGQLRSNFRRNLLARRCIAARTLDRTRAAQTSTITAQQRSVAQEHSTTRRSTNSASACAPARTFALVALLARRLVVVGAVVRRIAIAYRTRLRIAASSDAPLFVVVCSNKPYNNDHANATAQSRTRFPVPA